MNVCAANGCSQPIQSGQLMCKPCWSLVSNQTCAEVVKSYRNLNCTKPKTEHAYTAAKKKAIEEVRLARAAGTHRL